MEKDIPLKNLLPGDHIVARLGPRALLLWQAAPVNRFLVIGADPVTENWFIEFVLDRGETSLLSISNSFASYHVSEAEQAKALEIFHAIGNFLL